MTLDQELADLRMRVANLELQVTCLKEQNATKAPEMATERCNSWFGNISQTDVQIHSFVQCTHPIGHSGRHEAKGDGYYINWE